MNSNKDNLVPFATNLGNDADRWSGLESLNASFKDAAGVCSLSLTDTQPHYLVFAGSDKNFRELPTGTGVAVTPSHSLRVSAKFHSSQSVDRKLIVIEFDQNGRRVGDTWADFNETTNITLGPKTHRVLFAIRLRGRQPLSEVDISDIVLLDLGEDDTLPEQLASHSPVSRATPDNPINDFSKDRKAREGTDSIDLLARSGIFWKCFYEATAGLRFETLEDAMEHFVEVGMPKLWSCTPLVSPALLQEPLKSHWKDGDIKGVFSFLRQNENTINRLSYFFEPEKLSVANSEIQAQPAGVLSYFLDIVAPNTELPTSRGIIYWGDFKASVLRACEARLAEIDQFSAATTSVQELVMPELSMSGEYFPRLSIVLPVERIDEELKNSLTMIRNQDYENAEILVVGDVSPSEVAKLAGGLDLRSSLRVICEQTTSLPRLRNVGALSATGDYIAFVDHGVLWAPNFLSVCANKAQESDLDLIYSALRLNKTETPWGAALTAERQLLHNGVCFGAALVASRIFQKENFRFNEDMNGSHDHEFALSLRDHIRFIYIASPLAQHRQANDEFAMRALYESPSSRFESISEYWSTPGKSQEPASTLQRRGVSIVIPMFGNLSLTESAINAILENSSDEEFEIILVDNGSPFGTSWTIQALFASRPELKFKRLPENLNFALGCNYGAAFASMEYVLFLNNDTQVRQGWLRPLLKQMEDEAIVGVQSLLLYPDNSIQSCGTAFVARNALPVPFLVNLAPENAVQARNNRYKAVTAAALMVRLEDFRGIGGFDPRYVNGMEDIDFCLRLGQGQAKFAVCNESVVMHHESKTAGRGKNITYNRRRFFQRWAGKLPEAELNLWNEAGLDVAKITSDGNAIPSPRVSVVRSPSTIEQSWGIKYASKGGAAGDVWGDTYFVNSLGSAMRRAGLQPFTYRHGANTDYRSAIDRFNLVIRGLDRVAPVPGSTNILWVISHPEKVTEEEIAGFDLVYAASERWASKMSEKTGIEVHYLPQATDAMLFNPCIAKDEVSRGAVFVGSTHTGRRRRVVEEALSSGSQFSVIGRGWEGQLPSSTWESEGVANEELASIYRSSRYVLADHWPEMAEEGFIQNRIFDAVACGSRVISDPVPGVKEIFGAAVQTYSSSSELQALLSGDGDHLFPSDLEMLEISNRILKSHTFDNRVRRILDDATKML